MFLALLVLLALGESYRRTRHRIRAARPLVARDWGLLRADVAAALRRVARWEWMSLGAITALGIWLRLRDLAQPIRYDEAATWMDYASRPLVQGLADYRFPNNHLFHTLLVHVSAAAFGDGPVALRLPAFVAGVLLVPLTWGAARALHSRTAAPAAAVFAATSASLVLYSTNARGYTILCCLTMAIAIVAARELRRDNLAGWALIAVLAAVGMWTIPIMLYPLLGIALWMLAAASAGEGVLDARATRARLGWTGAAAAALTAVLYLPVIAHGGLALVVGNRFVRPQSRASFFAALPGFYDDLWNDWTRGWRSPAVLCLASGLAVALLAPRRAGRHRVSLFAASLAAATVLLVVNGRVPYLRVWMFLLPLAFAAAAGGLASIVRRVSPNSRTSREASLAILLAVLVAVLTTRALLATDVVRDAEDTGTLRDGAAIAALIARDAGPRDRIVSTAPADVPLAYHLRRLHLAHDPLRATPDSAPRLWVVVDDAAGQTVPELLGRGEVMTIDFAPPRLAARFAGARVFTLDRLRPGCRLAPERCR